MSEPILTASHLNAGFIKNNALHFILSDLIFKIGAEETFCLVGESGSGKSLTAQAILQLLDNLYFSETSGLYLEQTSLIDMPELKLRTIRGKRIAMIFQEPMVSFNPVLTIGKQITEIIRLHLHLTAKAARDKALGLLADVGLPDPQRCFAQYPHELSGGMRQRAMIAMALSADPDLLIADEPTTALDVSIQAQVLALLNRIKQSRRMGLLFITHDLGVVKHMADTVAVMYAGQIVEQTDASTFFASPQHPYSQKLLACLPSLQQHGRALATIPGSLPDVFNPPPACRFAPRCDFAWGLCHSEAPPLAWHAQTQVRCHLYSAAHPPECVATSKTPAFIPSHSTASDKILFQVEQLKVTYPMPAPWFTRKPRTFTAVDGVSFSIAAGETVALVGESGCGKSSLARALMQLMPYQAESMIFQGQSLTSLSAKALRQVRKDMQLIFQDPFSALNPRMTVAEILSEGWEAQGESHTPSQRLSLLQNLIRDVHLPEDSLARYPHEFSGGQRQRIAIARALALSPALLICDEPTSALDVCVQAQILQLLKSIQAQRGLAYLLISHNMGVVGYLADRILVMHQGKIVEAGSAAQILTDPQHAYTKALLAAVL